MYEQVSFSDEDSELASETTTVLVESDGGNERILRHDGSIVCPTSPVYL